MCLKVCRIVHTNIQTYFAAEMPFKRLIFREVNPIGLKFYTVFE